MKFILFLVISFGVNTVDAKEINLNEIKKYASINNFGVNAAKHDVFSNEKKIGQLKGNFLPKIGLLLSQEKNTSADISETENIQAVYGSLNLFNGFLDQGNLSLSQIQTKKSASFLAQSKFELNLRIEKMYYLFLYLQKRLYVTKESLERNLRHIKLIKKRLASSLVTETDLLQFQLKRARLKSREEFLLLQSVQVKEALLRTAGYKDVKGMDIQGDLPHFVLNQNQSEILSKGVEKNQSIQRAKLSLEESDYKLEMANSNWYPKVDLSVMHGHLDEIDTGIDNSELVTSVVVRARWELFSGFSTKNANESAQFEKIKSGYLLKQKVLDSSIILENNLKKLRTLQTRILAAEKNEIMARKFYGRTVREYQKGIKDSGALSNASEVLTQLNETIYELKTNYINTKLILEQSVGESLNFKIIKHKE